LERLESAREDLSAHYRHPLAVHTLSDIGAFGRDAEKRRVPSDDFPQLYDPKLTVKNSPLLVSSFPYRSTWID
jgi:hypothetical protein